MAKKFEFRLERVLRYRRHRQQQAELRQREAQNELLAAREIEDAVQAEFDQAARLPTATRAAFDPATLMNALAHLGGIEGRLKDARQQVAAARDALQAAEVERTQATQETEALSTLRDRKLAEHRRETELEAQDAVDENVMRKWSRSQMRNIPDEHAGPTGTADQARPVDFEA